MSPPPPDPKISKSKISDKKKVFIFFYLEFYWCHYGLTWKFGCWKFKFMVHRIKLGVIVPNLWPKRTARAPYGLQIKWIYLLCICVRLRFCDEQIRLWRTRYRVITEEILVLCRWRFDGTVHGSRIFTCGEEIFFNYFIHQAYTLTVCIHTLSVTASCCMYAYCTVVCGSKCFTPNILQRIASATFTNLLTVRSKTLSFSSFL